MGVTIFLAGFLVAYIFLFQNQKPYQGDILLPVEPPIGSEDPESSWPGNNGENPGDNLDEYGCNRELGYSWCESEGRCLRLSEERCSSPQQGKCMMTNCHGLDITCGPSGPMACTMEYRLGDTCRSHASCKEVAGTCQVAYDSKFETCKSCIELCEKQHSNDPEKAFTCESLCE